MVSGWPDNRCEREELERILGDGTGWGIALVLSRSEWVDVETDSEEAAAALAGMDLPPTPTWRSMRGEHRLFLRPRGIPKKAVVTLDGVEFRIGNGSGALSIVPPSPGREWLPGLSLYDLEPAELPEGIVQRLRGLTKERKAGTPARIPHGERNKTLFQLACRLFGAGLSSVEVTDTVSLHYAKYCDQDPPMGEKEIAGIVSSAEKTVAEGGGGARDVLLRVAEKAEYWRTPEGEEYATVPVGDHRENYPVGSLGFDAWLSREFYLAEKASVPKTAMADVLGTLKAKARYEGGEYPAFVRVGSSGERIYLDLGGPDWRAVEVDANGWRIVSDPPVRFYRKKAALALPEPARGGSLAELRPFVNVSDDHWPLVLGWLLAGFRPTGPFPVLKLLAEQGSGKTTLARVLRSVLDPNSAPVRSAPSGERDLMIAAKNGWVAAFDNLSFVNGGLSDALCRLATGGGFSTRKLYSDDEEALFSASRPVILNGIEDVGFRADLLDRSLVVELPRMEAKDRLPESTFWVRFDEVLPRILGAFLDAVSAALRNLPEVLERGIEFPRMADFAAWVIAGEGSLGLKQGRFLEAYETNRIEATRTLLEHSQLSAAVRSFMEFDSEWEGTATELLGKLGATIFPGKDTRAKDWPKSARALSGGLSRLAPGLRECGILVERGRCGNDKVIRLVNESPRGKGVPPPKRIRPAPTFARNGLVPEGFAELVREAHLRHRGDPTWWN